MPGVDWIPGISQLKSGFQLLAGDKAGAAETQNNFLQECPVLTVLESVAKLQCGDLEGALESHKRGMRTVNNVANGVPVVGHIKGAVHHFRGEFEARDVALNAASRTAVIMGSGAAAALLTGGLAAIPAGIAAGGAYDVASTVITEKPQGYLAAYDKVAKDPSAGNIFDAVCVHVGDGLAGYSGGEYAANLTAEIEMNPLKQTKADLKVANTVKISKFEAVRDLKQQKLDAGMFSEPKITTGEAISMGKEISALTKEINTLQGNTATLDLKSGNQLYSNVSSTNKGGVFTLGAPYEKEKTRIGEVVVTPVKEVSTGVAVEAVYAVISAKFQWENLMSNFQTELQNEGLQVLKKTLAAVPAPNIFPREQYNATSFLSAAIALPVVGHVKGAVHYLYEDHEGGNKTLNAASRTVAVMGAGAASAIVTGGGGIGGTQNEKEKKRIVEVVATPAKEVFTGVAAGTYDDLEGDDDDSLDDAFVHDYYENEEVVDATLGDKLRKLARFYEETGKDKKDKLPSLPSFPFSKLNSLRTKQKQFRRDKNYLELNELNLLHRWLHVRMPKEFPFTGAILLNNASHGLYHSVIRHHDQWQDLIPSFRTELQHTRFNSLQQFLKAVSKPKISPREARNATKRFLKALNELSETENSNVQSALFDLQLDLCSFIQANVTYENYMGEGVTENNEARLFFEVRGIDGLPRIMALGISSNNDKGKRRVYAPQNIEFDDARPIRTIVTAFIVSKKTATDQILWRQYKP